MCVCILTAGLTSLAWWIWGIDATSYRAGYAHGYVHSVKERARIPLAMREGIEKLMAIYMETYAKELGKGLREEMGRLLHEDRDAEDEIRSKAD